MVPADQNIIFIDIYFPREGGKGYIFLFVGPVKRIKLLRSGMIRGKMKIFSQPVLEV